MLDFLASLWNGFLQIVGLLLPFGKESKGWKMGPGLRWFLHALLLVLILVALFFLNRFVAHLVDVGFEWIKIFFLPLIFIGVYSLLWTGWWIWKLLMAQPEPSHFPDIDAAWAEAMRALAQAGISLTDKPLYLVLGRPEGAEENLFNAAQLQLVVKQTPPGPGAALHVYADRDAIYLTCPGASLLGKHAANVSLQGIDEQQGDTIEGEADSPEDKTIRPTGKEKKVIKQLAQIAGRQMNVIERRAARRDLGMPMPDLLKNPAEVEMYRARLAHLGRLVVRDRQPFCPINGIMILVPAGATDSEHDAQQTAELCARDLTGLRRVLKLRCPIFVLTCDFEAIPGFANFIQRVSTKERLGRLGQRFPLAPPDLAGEPLQAKMEQSIHHLCNNYLRDWVYRLFRVDGDDAAIAANTGLYLLLDEMRGRKKNLSRILTQGIARDIPTPLLYGGCYLAGTGPAKDREQAFVAGFLKRLSENQGVVSWTDEAIAEDRRCHRRANLGYTFLAGLVLAFLGALGYFFLHSRR